MRTLFRARLDAMDADLVAISSEVRGLMHDATTALLTADLRRAEQVISADAGVHNAAVAVEDQALALIASQQPVAKDARTVLATLRISASLARMADLAAHVAKAARLRYPEPAVPLEAVGVIEDMGSAADGMADAMVEALRERDADAAARLDLMDLEMDRLHREMFTIVMSPAWPCGVEAAVDIALASRYYERFADHAAAVARCIRYAATGQ